LKRESRRPWTPEEDELLRWHGPKVTLQKLSKILKKELDSDRTPRAISQRRRRIDPTWSSHLGGMISLVSISGLGSNQDGTNPRALRQAKADGVLQHRLILGRKAAVVPLEWADAWIAAEAENARRYEELRTAGWYFTTEIAAMLNVTARYLAVALKQGRDRGGAWRMFKNVEYVKLIDQRILWEPTGTRTAIAAYLRARRSTRTRTPKGAS